MPDAYTDNFDLILPEPGGSTDTWGDKLNENFSRIDGIMTDTRGTRVGEGDDLFNLPWTNNRFFHVISGSKPANYPDGAASYSEGLYLNRGTSGASTVILIDNAGSNGRLWWARASGGSGKWNKAANLEEVAKKLDLAGGTLTGSLKFDNLRPLQFLAGAFYSSGNMYIEGPTGGNDDNMVVAKRNGDGDYDWSFYGDVKANSDLIASGAVKANSGEIVDRFNIGGSSTINGNVGIDGTLRLDGSQTSGDKITVNNADYEKHYAFTRGDMKVEFTATTGGGGAVVINSTNAPSLQFNGSSVAMKSDIPGNYDSRYYTKSQVDDKDNAKLDKSGGSMSGTLAMNNNDITGVNKVVINDDGIGEGFMLPNFGFVEDGGTAFIVNGSTKLAQFYTSGSLRAFNAIYAEGDLQKGGKSVATEEMVNNKTDLTNSNGDRIGIASSGNFDHYVDGDYVFRVNSSGRLDRANGGIDPALLDNDVGAVGTYGYFQIGGNKGKKNPGDTVAGSDIKYAGSNYASTQSPAGTWRLMGAIANDDGNGTDSITLCLRIA